MFPLVKRGGVTWVKGGAVEKEVRDNLRGRAIALLAFWGRCSSIHFSCTRTSAHYTRLILAPVGGLGNHCLKPLKLGFFHRVG